MTTVIRILFSFSSPRPWPALEISFLAFSFLRLDDASLSMGRIFDRLHAIVEPLKFLVLRHVMIVGKVHDPSIIRYFIVSTNFVDGALVINIIVELLWLRKLLFIAFRVMMDWLYFIIVRNC